ncbi:YqgE/AlgH family protein [Synoicihabitans lomoniglobus]|uniref:YqgE/AlgH family protein n=1 Tax=Synoicihabitans lomoniglobus TaxID=2909285 RepID=A0AAF0I3S7_9BACT|nr:YqgE/AlgH family protein [Opitutaceae bacterium LMO-M01]WED66463.1 YqgE/AlgH family protein [Opitutaceae bacterium LMO-M01]
MRERGKTTAKLAGSLLLAHPGLQDPNFRHAAILLSAHDDEGAMGVVLNRPTGQTLAELDDAFGSDALAKVRVFAGGPVQTDRLLICAIGFHEDGEGLRLHFGLEPAAAESLVAAQGDAVTLRAFLGYSGWGAGQLENELKQDTWAVSAIPSDILDFTFDDSLWRHVISRVSPEWRLLANEPEDPELN